MRKKPSLSPRELRRQVKEILETPSQSERKLRKLIEQVFILHIEHGVRIDTIRELLIGVPPRYLMPFYIRHLASGKLKLIELCTEQLGEYTVVSALPALIQLLYQDNDDAFDMALLAIRKIDESDAIPDLLEVAKTRPHATARILRALSKMLSFTKWRKIKPYLDHDDTDIKTAAIECLVQKCPKKAWEFFQPMITKDQDHDILIEIISGCSHILSKKVALDLVTIATSFPDPKIRHYAGWEIDRIPDASFSPLMNYCLAKARPNQIGFILYKIVIRGTPKAGKIVTRYINRRQDPGVMVAAIEALGELRDPKYLKWATRYLNDPDPALAYAAGVATVQMTVDVTKSKAILDILDKNDPSQAIIIEAILKYMVDLIDWDEHNPVLLNIFERYLKSDVFNIRLITLTLIKTMELSRLLPHVLEIVFHETEVDIKAEAIRATDGILKGELEPVFSTYKALSKSDPNQLLSVLGQVRCNGKWASHAIEWMKNEPWESEGALDLLQVFVDRNVTSRHSQMMSVARDLEAPWKLRLACTRACLSPPDIDVHPALVDLTRELVADPDPRIAKWVRERLAKQKNLWAASLLVRQYVNEQDPAIAQSLVRHIRTGMEV